MNRALVVGGGFGGIASAIRLRAKGYDVQLLDRCPRLGGRAQVFERDGFRFDAGPTVITAPFLFDELFELHGRRREDYVEFRPLDPWYRFQFSDGDVFDYGGEIEDTEAEIARFNAADVEGYRRLVAHSEKIFDVGFTELSDRPFHKVATMLAQIPALLKLKCYRTVWQMVCAYLKDPKLRQAFSVQPLLVGGNPFDTTSIYGLIHFLERRWGIHFAMGGTGALVEAYRKLMEELGITITLNTTVDKILVENRQARGVRLESGAEIEADVVVANVDPKYLYGHMLESSQQTWAAIMLCRWACSFCFSALIGNIRISPITRSGWGSAIANCWTKYSAQSLCRKISPCTCTGHPQQTPALPPRAVNRFMSLLRSPI